jgi:hypothetical protein
MSVAVRKGTTFAAKGGQVVWRRETALAAGNLATRRPLWDERKPLRPKAPSLLWNPYLVKATVRPTSGFLVASLVPRKWSPTKPLPTHRMEKYGP